MLSTSTTVCSGGNFVDAGVSSSERDGSSPDQLPSAAPRPDTRSIASATSSLRSRNRLWIFDLGDSSSGVRGVRDWRRADDAAEYVGGTGGGDTGSSSVFVGTGASGGGDVARWLATSGDEQIRKLSSSVTRRPGGSGGAGSVASDKWGMTFEDDRGRPPSRGEVFVISRAPISSRTLPRGVRNRPTGLVFAVSVGVGGRRRFRGRTTR